MLESPAQVAEDLGDEPAFDEAPSAAEGAGFDEGSATEDSAFDEAAAEGAAFAEATTTESPAAEAVPTESPRPRPPAETPAAADPAAADPAADLDLGQADPPAPVGTDFDAAAEDRPAPGRPAAAPTLDLNLPPDAPSAAWAPSTCRSANRAATSPSSTARPPSTARPIPTGQLAQAGGQLVRVATGNSPVASRPAATATPRCRPTAFPRRDSPRPARPRPRSPVTARTQRAVRPSGAYGTPGQGGYGQPGAAGGGYG